MHQSLLSRCVCELGPGCWSGTLSHVVPTNHDVILLCAPGSAGGITPPLAPWWCCAQVESFLLALQPLLQAAGHVQQQEHHQQHQHHEFPHQQPQQPPPHHQQQRSAQQHQPVGQPQQHLHIVDFGCGTGNLLLPLAALLPGCRFTGVDMKPAALQLLQQRAAAAGLCNVAVFQGMIEQFDEAFDVALALHACGNATDHVLQVGWVGAAAVRLRLGLGMELGLGLCAASVCMP